MQDFKFIENTATTYVTDILDDRFESITLCFPDDYEGEVVATLIRRKLDTMSNKAILYVHGFNDYFFQKELAKRYNKNGFHFYALDLRKYGRSYLSHQKLNNVRSLLEYDEEINMALQIIKSEKNKEVILMGHSTGGLIVTNYAVNHLNSTLFHGVLCNSPFYEFNLNDFERKMGIPILSFLGRYFPNKTVSGGFSKLYGHSLHQDKYGEWEYSLAWKPHDIPKINLGFISAIHEAQENLKNKLVVDVPILVMHSDKSIYQNHWSEKLKEGDAVLNIDHIRHYANKIKGNVTICEIENGMHDLILSKKPIGENVYKKMFEWVSINFKSTQTTHNNISYEKSSRNNTNTEHFQNFIGPLYDFCRI
ncbi:Lysophospholipase, alpha-beta hydrolase superfamily [Maribacter orientalis]|uniref:Lysophospholipase, alpha-beta hydrolase superfamily n=1 Tax=Maribacter orientalis TaxID=228957 RepID=A0A1H7SP22_9FLAO|nr:alpha/beta hydrolase [Maribacter orientalis]SEL73227.1 Lysophospholipase, alpha-beta hydrolase superfamily [Maribacter orientalis]